MIAISGMEPNEEGWNLDKKKPTNFNKNKQIEQSKFDKQKNKMTKQKRANNSDSSQMQVDDIDWGF